MDEKSIEEFLSYLENIKNYSSETIKNYDKDLKDFLGFMNSKYKENGSRLSKYKRLLSQIT